MSTDAETQLEIILLGHAGLGVRDGIAFVDNPVAAYAFTYGRAWTPAALPSDIPPGETGRSFDNALALTTRRPELRYVEGYALREALTREQWEADDYSGTEFVCHAWCVDAEDRVVDPTWVDQVGAAYYGVAFGAGDIAEALAIVPRDEPTEGAPVLWYRAVYLGEAN